MAILSSIRRRSRLFRTGSTNEMSTKISDLKGDIDNSPSDESSSTIDSVNGSTTPPSSIIPTSQSSMLLTSQSAMNLSTVPLSSAPSDILKTSYRNSFIAPPTTPSHAASRPPTSPFAPNILSISDNSWVNQQVLFVHGIVGERDKHILDGTVTVTHHQDNFPAMTWPVFNSQFKALIHLSPGPNRLRFDVRSPKLPHNNASTPAHSSFLTIHMMPAPSSPPLRLCILAAKDSPMVFDAVPERIARETNSFEMAVQKFRMAAYLWQSFTTEQMSRNKLGRRCFRFEEEWATGTLSSKDKEDGTMRSQAAVHLLRTDKTVAELHALDSTKDAGALLEIASEAYRRQFPIFGKQQHFAAILILDTHWDKDAGKLKGDASISGSVGGLNMAVFGSSGLQAFPSTLDEVVGAFSDCTRTDTKYVANENGESGSNWEAFSTALGRQLRQIGKMFGCQEQEYGVMARESHHLNRTFVARESFSTRTGKPGLKGYSAMDECRWHRLDCLKFRYHPCFRLPTDQPIPAEAATHYWPVDGGNVLVTSAAGIAFVEICANGASRAHLEYTAWKQGPENFQGPRKEVMLNETELRARLPENLRSASMRLIVHTSNNTEMVIEDFSKLTAKSAIMKLPNGTSGFRSKAIGTEGLPDSQSQEVVLETVLKEPKIMTSIKVSGTSSIASIEFIYENETSMVFGVPPASDATDVKEFKLDWRRGETLLGFYVRGSTSLEGLEILSTMGRRSGMFGNSKSGVGCSLVPPRGYRIAGVSGSYRTTIDSLALLISR